jgi:hypothetical protein
MPNRADVTGSREAAVPDRPMQGAAARPTLTRRTLAASLLFAAAPAVLRSRPAAAASDWPSRPIRLVVGFGPGGAGDITARLLAPS